MLDLQRKNQLNINEPDSIFLFGNDIQTEINGYTKTISDIILYGNGETDYIILEMKQAMDSFEEGIEGKFGKLKSFLVGKSSVRKNYTMALSNINKLELALKLQGKSSIMGTLHPYCIHEIILPNTSV